MKKHYIRNITILAMAVVFIVVFFIWQNNDIVTTRYNYKTTQIDGTLNGYTIAQISDLHNKEFGRKQADILKLLEKQKPDIIVITGDIVDSSHTDIDKALDFVKGAVEMAPVYYVTGNHEFCLSKQDFEKLMNGMEHAGATLLDNKAINLENEKGNGFYLIGLSDINLSDNTLSNLCSDLDTKKLQIVLAHEPQYLDNYSKTDADLVLSGHAHGGQIRLPFIGGLVAPGQGFFPKYTSGIYTEHNTTMIVSRGLGNSIIPVRVFNRPEIVMITLQKE